MHGDIQKEQGRDAVPISGPFSLIPTTQAWSNRLKSEISSHFVKVRYRSGLLG
jgi:hypothetical protein